MKISMVTLSFNQGRFLETAITSVLGQSYPHLDYIIVDPGSTDQSRSIIDRYRAGIDTVVYEPDRGPADGLNRGFAHANGDIFGFLNADDILEPGTLAAVAEAFERHVDTDVIAGHGWLINEAGERVRPKYSYPFSAWRYLHRGSYLLQQSTFFRASAYRAVQGFNVDNKSCWDGELWLDMALANQRFQIVDAFWSGFRIYRQSITGSVASNGHFRKLYNGDRRRMFERVTGRPPEGPLYWTQRAAAEVLKWTTSPAALKSRLFSVLDPRSRQAPI